MDVRFLVAAVIVMAMFGILTQKLYVKGRKFSGTNALYTSIMCSLMIGWTMGSFLSYHRLALEKDKVYTILWCERNKTQCLLVTEGKEPFYYDTGKHFDVALLEVGKRITTFLPKK